MIALFLLTLMLSSSINAKPIKQSIVKICQFTALHNNIISDNPYNCTKDIKKFYEDKNFNKYDINDVLFLAEPAACPKGYNHSKIEENMRHNKDKTNTYQVKRICFK